MPSIIAAITSAISFGVGNVIIKKSEQTDLSLIFSNSALAALALLAITITISGSFSLTVESVSIGVILGIIEFLLYIFLYRAISAGDITVVSALMGMIPLFTTIVGILLLGSIVGLFDWIFILAMVMSAILISIDIKGVFIDGLDRGDFSKGLIWAIAAIAVQVIYFPAVGLFFEASPDLAAHNILASRSSL